MMTHHSTHLSATKQREHVLGKISLILITRITELLDLLIIMYFLIELPTRFPPIFTVSMSAPHSMAIQLRGSAMMVAEALASNLSKSTIIKFQNMPSHSNLTYLTTWICSNLISKSMFMATTNHLELFGTTTTVWELQV